MPEVKYIFKTSGVVIHGFGRGSRDLGTPTGTLLFHFHVMSTSEYG